MRLARQTIEPPTQPRQHGLPVKGDAERLRELLDLHVQRRLREVQRPRRPGEVEVLGEHDERLAAGDESGTVSLWIWR